MRVARRTSTVLLAVAVLYALGAVTYVILRLSADERALRLRQAADHALILRQRAHYAELRRDEAVICQVVRDARYATGVSLLCRLHR